MIRSRKLTLFSVMFLILTLTNALSCQTKRTSNKSPDWPMWRYDAGHTANGGSLLPNDLHLEWSRTYSKRVQVWDDPLNHDLMPYDRVFEPICKAGRLYIGFNDSDKVVALDLKTGDELWRFYTDGPVRFPAVAWKDFVYFTSDDGNLYCLDGGTGKLNWKFQGAPASQKVIGNHRLISAWPARGGPVVADDKLYFAAGIWPFMGTFIYCLDPLSGEVIWLNDRTSAQYVKQPHSAPSFAGVGPQGTLVVNGDHLLVPGGRSVPAAFDRHTGDLRHFLINAGGKGNGGSLVLAKHDEFFVHTRERGVRAYELNSGNKTVFMTNEPVLSETAIYSASGKEGKYKVTAFSPSKKPIWQIEDVDGTGDIIKSGDRLYLAGKKRLTALQLRKGKKPKEIWSQKVTNDFQRLIAANGKLIAVALDGSIHCYGDSKNDARDATTAKSKAPLAKSPLATFLARDAKLKKGFVVYWGKPDRKFLYALLHETQFDVNVIANDLSYVDESRRHFDQLGVYGKRVSFHVGSVDSFRAPPYVAQYVLFDEEQSKVVVQDSANLELAYQTVRPYGGRLIVVGNNRKENEGLAQQLRAAKLEKAMVTANNYFAVANRVGALPGAADWTHQYGNVANTVKSDDQRVKLPLGLLWFGGSSNMDVLPRHGHGPPEQVIGGRLFIQGMNSLSCRDVYTGSVLWKREFDDLGTFGIYFDETYENTPLDSAYNQVHIPGANGRGTNYVATDDAVYIVEADTCHILDPNTGTTRQKIVLPQGLEEDVNRWGYIGIYEDVLIGGSGYANYGKRKKLSFEESDSKLEGNSKGYGSKSLDTAASTSLIGFNRHTGEVLWQVDAIHSFIHNGIVAGDDKVFCLDKLPKPVEDKLKRRGASAPDSYRIVAIDYKTGIPVWEQTGKIFGTWLGYSEQYNLLLHAGASASDRLKSETGQGMAVYRGDDGSVQWRVEKREYSGPCILHNDTILTNANSYQLSSGAFSLLDGNPKMILNPITQKKEPWRLSRAYGCNNIIASENLLTFRSGAAGFYDLESLSGTGNLGGFKSGCTSNLVVANGVLNAPDYTRTCSCAYQNQTSLALVHMPEMEMWTVNHAARLTKPGERIRKIGINFGAPGDRTDSKGMLWLDYPVVGGDSIDLPIEVQGEVDYFHRSSLAFQGSEIPWVISSGIASAADITIPLTVKKGKGLHFPVEDKNDDAEEDSTGVIELNSSDLEFVTDKEKHQVIGLRFNQIKLERGQKIDAAYIQFHCDESSEDKTELTIAIQDAIHAKPFTDESKNVSSRSVLSETVAWSPKEWKKEGESGSDQRTPDLTKLIRSVIDREDWTSGNALAFIVKGKGKRIASSRDGDEKHAPVLVVEVEEEVVSDPKVYTLRMHFAEPEKQRVGDRVFDIEVQGKQVENDFDILELAKRPKTTVVREYQDIVADQNLRIKLHPQKGQPILCGIEIIEQSAK